ncbi:MAG: FAD-binding protein [Rhodopirellula sp.]|nr:FAD-binding protein [Rhodopirellula sp.]
MDEQRQRRILEDLSGDFSGDVRCDDVSVAMYASDASLFEVKPLGVAFPRDADDVATLTRYASETDLPLIARGAGTSVTGAALGSGLIVDFSRHMNRIVLESETSITVQPGIVLAQLNRELRKKGRYFPPDPSTAEVTTLGGMVSVDSAGSRAIRVGSTRDHVIGIEMAVAGGHLLHFGRESLEFSRVTSAPELSSFSTSSVEPLADAEDRSMAAATAKREIVGRLSKLLEDNHELIRQYQPQLLRNSSGYYLRGVRDNGFLNLPRLIAGSEGTLGLMTELTLHTSPLPEFRSVALLLFGKMEDAIDSVLAVISQQPSACDLLDRRLLMLGRENDSRFANFIPPTAEAGLLIEQTGFSEQQARDRIEMAISAVKAVHADVLLAIEAWDFDGVEFLWELPHRVVSLLARMRGGTRPLPFLEDVAVPPEALQEFFVRIQQVLRKHDVTASLYSHAASGQIHMRPFMSTPRQKDGPRLDALIRDFNDVAISLGGTISGEHGDGLSRSAFVKDQYGPLYSVFRQVKDIFDPHNLMNPGKIVTEDETLPASKFRPELVDENGFVPENGLVQLQLNWSPAELSVAAEACNGCGGCRTQHEELRMCPFFRNDPSEESSPRSKANVMRSLVSGASDPATRSSPEFQKLASLCFNCRQCELECPTNVRIPHLMIEAKAQAAEASGTDRATWFLSRAHFFGALGCRTSWLSNRLLRSRAARWVIEKTFKIHRDRQLPEFANRPYLSTLPADVTDSVPTPRQEAVVYFVDHFANYHDPELAEAFVAVMQHHGIRVHVPAGQIDSGMAMVSTGDLNAARRMAEANIRELASMAREGLPIICTEPAAALCLKEDYPMLVEHPDTRLISSLVIEAGAYLQQLFTNNRLKTDFTPLPLKIGYHEPCHLRALQNGRPLRELLELIPELDVLTLDKGCSGMAGTFGLTRDNFKLSLDIGKPLIDAMRNPDFVLGATECSSCRLQMQQESPIETIHPIKLLAASYGLMPRLRNRLTSRQPATER